MYQPLFKTAALLLATGCIAFQVQAQEVHNTPSGKKEERILIRKKGDTKEKLTIVVDGDNITINGKPLDEFTDGDITITRNFNRNLLVGPRPPHPPRPLDELEIFSTARVNKAFLGVSSEKASQGVKIVSVTKDSPAEKAGLQETDIITQIGDSSITTSEELYKAIGRYKPDDSISITYLRDGKTAAATVVLGKNKTPNVLTLEKRMFNQAPGATPPLHLNWSRKPRVGLQLQDLEKGEGVKVLEVVENTPAAKAGLKKEDVITSINGKKVTSVEDVQDHLEEVKEGDRIQLNYHRGGENKTVEISIPKKLKTANL